MTNLTSRAAPRVPGYRHSGPILFRATTYDSCTAPPDPTNFIGDTLDTESARAWLRTIWQHDDFRAAVALASPVLANRTDDALATAGTTARQLRRLEGSLAGYLLRWQGRPTPFGLFAGVATAVEGPEPVVEWGFAHRVVARPDATWLSAITGCLEGDAGVLARLSVMTNSAMSMRDDLLIVPGQPPDDHPTTFAPLEVTLRQTEPITVTLRDARRPIRFAELMDRLAGRYPHVSADQIRSMLTGLVEQRFLITALRAPMTETDALGHLVSALERAAIVELLSVRSIVEDLRHIHAAVLALNNTKNTTRTAHDGIARRMRALAEPTTQPLPVDLQLDCTVRVPPEVLRESESVVAALLRLSPHQFGFGHWKEYHVRFRRWYGSRAVVPVLDLVADSGLGLPASYLGSGVNVPPRPSGVRDERLMALLHETLRHGRGELILTDAMIEALRADTNEERIPPERVELVFQLHAADLDALAHGRFRLWVTGVPRPECSMAGRFMDLLDPTEQRRWAASYARQPWPAGAADADGRIVAQLSFPPRLRRSDNVARTPELLPVIVPLGEYRDAGEAMLPLGDIGVTANASRFDLVHMPTGRIIDISVLHAIDAAYHTPPLARFLAEISGARRTAYHGFDWGLAVSSRYLPRVRYGRTVLRPARWLLTADELPGRAASDADWAAVLRTWQKREVAPAAIVLVEHEQRLPLDLGHRVHRALLRARLNRAGAVELQEAPPAHALGAVGRAHEFLVPLAAKVESAPGRPLPTLVPVRATHPDVGQFPGGAPWLQLRLFTHPARFDSVLLAHLPRLLDGWNALRWWWFDRHRDLMRPADEQYLNLYLRLETAGDAAAALCRAADWAADLRHTRLLARLEAVTYQRQTGRFGWGMAMDAAERAFAADAAAVIVQLSLARQGVIDPLVVTVASLSDLAMSYLAEPDAGARWLLDNLDVVGGPLNRDVRDAAMRITDPTGDFAALRSLPAGESVLAAWRQRRSALTEYRTTLRPQRDPGTVLGTLLHLHQVRMLGLDPDREALGRRLVRAVAKRDLARSSRRVQEPSAGDLEWVAP